MHICGWKLTTPDLRPVASATWRELIKRGWEVDPLLCLRCGTEMVKLAAIRDPAVIIKILRHLHLWEEPPARGPPPGLPAVACPLLGRRAAQAGGTVYEPCYDDPPAAAESNDSSSAEEVQAFPDYDAVDPAPVYD
jgi:hypothetical protein